MKKCKNCFYSTACMAFEELNVTGEEAPCENFLDTSMVIVLPCPVGTTVYEKYKDCEHCPNYHEVAYSDYVSCEEDNELYTFSHKEEFRDDEKECLKHIKTKEISFNINMLNRIGRDVFLTKNVVFIETPDDIYTLQGYQYGKTLFENAKTIDYSEPITFVFEKQVKSIGESFIHGFFAEIMEEAGIEYVMNYVHVISDIKNLKNKIVETLM